MGNFPASLSDLRYRPQGAGRVRAVMGHFQPSARAAASAETCWQRRARRRMLMLAQGDT
jgi:hypothetical protein